MPLHAAPGRPCRSGGPAVRPRTRPLLNRPAHRPAGPYRGALPDLTKRGPMATVLSVSGSPSATYSGPLKSLLDLLPQYAPTGNTVLPLATGGSTAHVLAIDYALRPVLSSTGAAHITQGWFVLDRNITVSADGTLTVQGAGAEALGTITDAFTAAPESHAPVAVHG
ncbi:NAD(P)H-dependent oxidoreductase [Streptomyces sp. NPDC004980]